MRKYLLSLSVIALFSIGFAASDPPKNTIYDTLGEALQEISKAPQEIIKAPQEKFLETIDRPETAYMVRIDEKVIRTDIGVGKVEVPVGKGGSQNSYEWTLIFFPTNDEKTRGKARMEPWCIDRDAWADGKKISYNYEVRDDRIELYNGVSYSIYHQKYISCRDVRLTIENDGGNIQLRGEFSDQERVFKLTRYRDSRNKDSHNRN